MVAAEVSTAPDAGKSEDVPVPLLFDATTAPFCTARDPILVTNVLVATPSTVPEFVFTAENSVDSSNTYVHFELAYCVNSHELNISSELVGVSACISTVLNTTCSLATYSVTVPAPKLAKGVPT